MGLLEKFDTVTLDRTSQLDAIDQDFVAAQERAYNEARAIVTEARAKMQALYDTYPADRWGIKRGCIDAYKDLHYLNDRLKAYREAFIALVVRHFCARYQVTLDANRISEALAEQELTGKAIVEQIFAQLGGISFAERAVLEIRQNVARHVWGEPEIKGTRLILNGFADVDYWDKKWRNRAVLSSSAREKMAHLVLALSHFETGEPQLAGDFVRLSHRLSGSSASPYGEKLEVDAKKVKSIRLYQSGKVEITFASYELAAQFLAGYARKTAA